MLPRKLLTLKHNDEIYLAYSVFVDTSCGAPEFYLCNVFIYYSTDTRDVPGIQFQLAEYLAIFCYPVPNPAKILPVAG